MRGLVWLKKDLRLHDNPALYHACHVCDEGVSVVYVLDLEMWKKNNTSHYQITFILESLALLKEDLLKKNISFFIDVAHKTEDVPKLLLKHAVNINVGSLFFNEEYEINEARRNSAVESVFLKNTMLVEKFHDQLILPFQDVKTQQGEYFKVFTAFKRQWLVRYMQQQPLLRPIPTSNVMLDAPPSAVSSSLMKRLAGSIDLSQWAPGERAAKKCLKKFIAADLFDYDKYRDFPLQDKTSKLSPYLAVGMISPRLCFHAAYVENACEASSGNKGALTWMSELIWREFYRHILIAVPRVCMNQAYQVETEKLPWCYREDLFHAWTQGKTGYPLVDAAMRQLNTTGWMHNRLRMVAAMFLSKNLFLDWRLGEKYFEEHLIDIDFASNNGGWQWSASTGTDAVPYFRVFNPIMQSQRFDPKGDFIRLYVPELREFTQKTIHEPYQLDPEKAKRSGYPEPIVAHKETRQFVIAEFKKLKYSSPQENKHRD